jgi:hypothetical protein
MTVCVRVTSTEPHTHSDEPILASLVITRFFDNYDVRVDAASEEIKEAA